MASKTISNNVIHVGDTIESLHLTAGCMTPFPPCFANRVQCNASPISVYVRLPLSLFKIVFTAC